MTDLARDYALAQIDAADHGHADNAAPPMHDWSPPQ